MNRDWTVQRRGLLFVASQLMWSDAFGAAYRFARKNGFVCRFLTRKAAQKYADKLNATPSAPETGGEG